MVETEDGEFALRPDGKGKKVKGPNPMLANISSLEISDKANLQSILS